MNYNRGLPSVVLHYFNCNYTITAMINDRHDRLSWYYYGLPLMPLFHRTTVSYTSSSTRSEWLGAREASFLGLARVKCLNNNSFDETINNPSCLVSPIQLSRFWIRFCDRVRLPSGGGYWLTSPHSLPAPGQAPNNLYKPFLSAIIFKIYNSSPPRTYTVLCSQFAIKWCYWMAANRNSPEEEYLSEEMNYLLGICTKKTLSVV